MTLMRMGKNLLVVRVNLVYHVDEIYSENGYYSMHMFDYSCCSGFDDYYVGNREGLVYMTDLENLIITLKRKFKGVQKLRFYLKQYSIKSNFNYRIK